MNDDALKTPIEYLKGVGPKRAQLLQKELGVFTVEDLLQHYPFRHEDRSQVHKISSIKPDQAYVQIYGRLHSIQRIGKSRSQRLKAILEDETGRIELVWFKGVQWLSKSLKEGQNYLIFGKASIFNSNLNIPKYF